MSPKTKTWTLRLAGSYLVACIFGALFLNSLGMHGPIVSFPGAFLEMLILPLEIVSCFVRGDASTGWFLLALMSVLFALALACVWSLSALRRDKAIVVKPFGEP